MRTLFILLAVTTFGCGAAAGHTVRFRGARLMPIDTGIPGAKRFTLKFAVVAMPAPGQCTSNTKLISFSDGVNSNTSLAAAGYTRVPYDKNNQFGSVETICANAAGQLDPTTADAGEVWRTADEANVYMAYANPYPGSNGVRLIQDQQPNEADSANTGRWTISHKK
jgi:hypothetical protein